MSDEHVKSDIQDIKKMCCKIFDKIEEQGKSIAKQNLKIAVMAERQLADDKKWGKVDKFLWTLVVGFVGILFFVIKESINQPT